jgi:hypothetical protein
MSLYKRLSCDILSTRYTIPGTITDVVMAAQEEHAYPMAKSNRDVSGILMSKFKALWQTETLKQFSLYAKAEEDQP